MKMLRRINKLYLNSGYNGKIYKSNIILIVYE